MRIEFEASLEGGTTMRVGDENSGKLTLTFDGTQWPHIAQLSMYQRRRLKVIIDTDVSND